MLLASAFAFMVRYAILPTMTLIIVSLVVTWVLRWGLRRVLKPRQSANQ